MALSGKQYQRIHDALLNGYDETTLQLMVRFKMEEDLDRVVGPGNLAKRMYDLVGWADRSGRVEELVQAAHSYNPSNKVLSALHAEWFDQESDSEDAAPVATTPLSPQIFLAYSSKDETLMQRLQRILVGADFSVWTAERLHVGTERWDREIKSAIGRTKCMVLLCTPDAEQSKWVDNEIKYASALGRRIFPVLARGEPTEAIPFSVFGAQWVDARKHFDESVASDLLPDLRQHLGVAELEIETAPARKAPARRKPSKQATPVLDTAPQRESAQRSSPSSSSPLTFDWVTIPAGEFLMGSDKEKDSMAYDDETPQHTIYVAEYQIARVPVTNAQYKLFVDAFGYRAPSYWNNGGIPKGKEEHPVADVTWDDAIAFCEWAGVRLPTEAEWEKAARGTDGRIWPWGDNKPTGELCNFRYRDTTPVGSYPAGASPYGCLDMAGNVWEWTNSQWKDYPYDATDGRESPDEGRRVLRGGSFYHGELNLRCAARFGNPPNLIYRNYGFRLCAAPITPGR